MNIKSSILNNVKSTQKNYLTLLTMILFDQNHTNFNELTEDDWRLLIDEAIWQKVITNLVYKVKNSGFIPPTNIVDLLNTQSTYEQTIIKMQLFELQILNEIFKKAGIDYLLLKGLGLSKLLYDSIYQRFSKDIDILIPTDKIHETVDALKKDGYCILYETDFNPLQAKIAAKTQNQFVAYHSVRKICIEVHWKVSPNPHMPTKSFDCIWSRKEMLVLDGTSINIMPPMEYLIYLCLHVSKTTTLRLKWFVDIDKMIDVSGLDRSLVMEASRKYNCRFAVESTFFMIDYLSDRPRTNPKSNYLRIKFNNAWSLFVLKDRSKFPRLARLRSLLIFDNLKSLSHDLGIVFGPRLFEARNCNLSPEFFCLLYPKRWMNSVRIIAVEALCDLFLSKNKKRL